MVEADQSSVSPLAPEPAAKEGCRQQQEEAEAQHVADKSSVSSLTPAEPAAREVRAFAFGKTQEARFFKVFLCVATAVFVLFLFSLPLLSWLFNDVFGLSANLCKTPADQIQCGNHESYVQIAEKLGRRNASGELIGCGCEEGIFRDWSCAVGTTSFSVSYFISTAPGTGAMAALSAWPMLGSWSYGAGTLRKMSQTDEGVKVQMDTLGVTLIAYQFFFGLFLINTTCIAPMFHMVVVVLFNGAAVVHYLTVAYYIGRTTKAGLYIQVSVTCAIVAMFIGIVWPIDDSWFGQHAFWLGECIGLSCGMSIAPILMYWGDTPRKKKEPSALEGAEAQAEAPVGVEAA